MRAWFLAAMLMAGVGAQAQSVAPANGESATAKPLRFEVVSVKVNKTDSGNMSWQGKPDGMRMIGISLENLLMSAYGLYTSPEGPITGMPKWAETARFDVEARVAPEDLERYKNATTQQGQEILRALLEDRFALKATPVTNERPMYALVVAKGGPKLTPAKEVIGPDGVPVKRSRMATGSGSVEVTDGDLSTLVMNLTGATGWTVIDKTGLTGKYDYTLKWTPNAAADAGADSGKAAAPPVFTALQEQLGLRLDSTRGPVKGLTVEHVEMPSAN